jgi:hypothetical protein
VAQIKGQERHTMKKRYVYKVLMVKEIGNYVNLTENQLKKEAEKLKREYEMELWEVLELHYNENGVVCTDRDDSAVFTILRDTNPKNERAI